jgi:hypothetical protein
MHQMIFTAVVAGFLFFVVTDVFAGRHQQYQLSQRRSFIVAERPARSSAGIH